MADFLLEIGTEEIPARMIAAATDELTRRVRDLITREHLASDPTLEAYSTPRRLAVLARGVSASQPDVEEQVMGPSLKVAFKDGQPTPAAHAFAKKVNLDLDKCEKISTAKGEYLAATVKKQGRPAAELLSELLPKEIAGVYWAKNMYWREGKPERFVRPVRWIVALLDGKVVPLEFAGTAAGNISRGHRVLANGEVKIPKPADYAKAMEKAAVIPTYAAREHRIRKTLDAATRTVAGARWREDKDLLDTVVNLTEFPAVLLGNFDREYLSLPEEVLVTVMRDHQKYFAVEDETGKLAPHFLAVLNTEVDGEGMAIIRHGNERVLRARFNDARFFWTTDQKASLRDRVQGLKNVTFQKDLGSYFDKTERVGKLAMHVADDLRHAGITVTRAAVAEAAMLSKTDLTTELVKEFTELQGIIGGLYARHQGHDEKVAAAVYDQYKPESMEDAVPSTLEGAVLAMADKADSIAGMFALGMQPTGSKDPFALRRAANGIVRILAEHNLPLSLSRIINYALEGYRGTEAEKKFTAGASVSTDVAGFFRERLEFYLRDMKGFAYDVVNAVLAADSDNVVDALARAEAVAKVRPSDDFESISIAFKRMKNILRQASETGKQGTGEFDAAALQEEQEKVLAAQIPGIAATVRELRGKGNYYEALTEISKLRKPIDAFFDKVMVMVDDEKLRSNRLGLLQTLLNEFSTIADFSEIVTEKK